MQDEKSTINLDENHGGSTGSVENVYELQIMDTISDIGADDWNHCVPPDYPFLKHEFLYALEKTGCVSSRLGWMPRHILLRNQGSRSLPLAVIPMYLKLHSYGEFIFDWAWADAYYRNGVRYYPKLVAQTPFTPLSGPKILVAPGADKSLIYGYIAHASPDLAIQLDANSIHWLFLEQQELEYLAKADYIPRNAGIQYVWRNQDYASMNEFLQEFNSKKRKNIRQERNFVKNTGVQIEIVEGSDIKQKHWDAFYRFYDATIMKYQSNHYLSPAFFELIGDAIPENIVLMLARLDKTYVAGSFCLKGEKSLYGRYWGSIRDIRNLHYELCYYSAIEYCIANKLKFYNAGMQGKHKLKRGFHPELPLSAHYFRRRGFHNAIDSYVEAESEDMHEYQAQLYGEFPIRR